MSRLTLSDEMSILNELSFMEEKLYKGVVDKQDVDYSVKTIKNLLLEIYLMKQQLNPEQVEAIDLHVKNSILAKDAAIHSYESNKAF